MFKNSILTTITKLIQHFKCVQTLHDGQSNMTSTHDHIATGIIFSLLFCSLAIVSKWFLIGIAIHFIAYVLWKELWHDRHKNKGYPFGHVAAQLIERGIGYVLCIPIIVLILIM